MDKLTSVLCVGGVADNRRIDYDGEIYRVALPTEKISLPTQKALKSPYAISMATMDYRKLRWHTKDSERSVWVPYESSDMEAIDALIENYKKSPAEPSKSMKVKIEGVAREVEHIMTYTPAPMKNHLHDVIHVQNQIIEELLKMMVKP